MVFAEIIVRKDLRWELMHVENVSRYGHSAVRSEDYLLLIGGFGRTRNGKHGRLKNITWLKYNEEEFTWKVCRETDNVDCASMYSTWTPVTDTSYVVYGGRTGPTQYTNEIPSLVTVSPAGVSSTPVVKEFDRQPRWRHSAVVARWNNDLTFVVFGGRTSDLKVSYYSNRYHDFSYHILK